MFCAIFLSFYHLVVFSGVTCWGDHRCIILEADTGHNLQTTRFSKLTIVPDRLVCQPEAGQLP